MNWRRIFTYKICHTEEFSRRQRELEIGLLDAILCETVVIPQVKKEHLWIQTIEEPIESYDIVFGFGKTENARKLKSQFNAFIAEIKENGVYEEMESYWISNFSPDTCVTDKSGITGENGKLTIALEGGYEPVFYEINYDAIIAGLESGKFHVGVNLLYTAERENSIEISEPYNILAIKVVAAGTGGEEGNFFQSLKSSFHKTFVKDSRWELFVEGAGTILFMTVVSMLLGTAFGFLLYLLCKEGSAAKRVTELVSFLIGTTPTVLFLMILYYVVFGSWNISGVWVSVIGFSTPSDVML